MRDESSAFANKS